VIDYINLFDHVQDNNTILVYEKLTVTLLFKHIHIINLIRSYS